MLTRSQVIEQRSGDENHEMKERITAQLESAAKRIRELEDKLERLRGGKYWLSVADGGEFELMCSNTSTF